MAKPGLSNIVTTQTFQTWLDTTNDIVDIIRSDAMTASALGDTTSGNATLLGNFTANNIVAFNLLRVDSISPKLGSSTVGFNSPISATSSTQTAATVISTNGPRINYSSGSSTWRTGFEDTTTNNFIIDNGAGTTKLSLTPTGNLTIAGTFNAIGGIVAGAGGLVGNLTGNVTGNVTGTVSSLSNHTTDNLTEGPNSLYFTNSRARNAISATGLLSYDASTGVMSLTNTTVRGLFSAGTGVTYDNTTGVISIGQAVATTSNVSFANLNTSGTIVSVGAITSDGDITAFASSSDIRKKENIDRIENALDKVLRVGGYTYNFIGDDRRITGVIAQEIEEILPEAVYEIDDPQFGSQTKAVRYGNIVGLLIEAIKELKGELDSIRKSSE
jgi:hypothetical protein